MPSQPTHSSQSSPSFFSKAKKFTGREVAPRVESLATGTALAAAATSPLNMLNAAMQGLNTASPTMTQLIGIAAQALPIVGITEGVIKTGRGAISLALTLLRFASKKTTDEDTLSKFVLNALETAQGSFLLHYGSLALQTGSSAAMFHGFFIARFIGLVSDIVSLVNEMKELKSADHDDDDADIRQEVEKKCLDVLFKTIEVAGWGLLMAGAPIGGIFLVPVLLYQGYKAMIPKPANAKGSSLTPLEQEEDNASTFLGRSGTGTTTRHLVSPTEGEREDDNFGNSSTNDGGASQRAARVQAR